MLTRLRVNNLALVDDITLLFESGLNVITGETGAGKSVLMGALALIIGQRADRSSIRSGKDQAIAEAEFYFKESSRIDAVLDELGLPPCEEGLLLIRRRLKTQGAGSNTINDSSVTVQALKSLGQHLVDLHGPHDHQSLFQQRVQMDVLDAFGHLEKEVKSYGKEYRELLEIDTQLELLQNREGDEDAQIDLLQYRIQELEDSKLSVEEEQQVQQEHQVAGNAAEILELSSALMNVLSEGEPSLFDLSTQGQQVATRLSRLYPEAEDWLKELTDLAGSIQELTRSVEHSLSRLDADPERMNWLDERLSLYQRLQRKYNRSIPELLEWLESSRETLSGLENRDQRIEELKQHRQQVLDKVLNAGGALTKKREKAGARLQKAVTGELKALGFEHGQFETHVEKTDPGLHGCDQIDFGFAPNLGEPMRPLRQIASSGEMSRVMLAVKSVLAGHDQIPVLVFDEIDANVGGEIGSAVGKKLQSVSALHQVLCITHLPQVAIHGRQHYAIGKTVQDDRTATTAARLSEEERVEEIARMLGGRDMTAVTLDHAREMLEHAS
jgi:DNA repair protein RecN (Recombination protein N)